MQSSGKQISTHLLWNLGRVPSKHNSTSVSLSKKTTRIIQELNCFLNKMFWSCPIYRPSLRLVWLFTLDLKKNSETARNLGSTSSRFRSPVCHPPPNECGLTKRLEIELPETMTKLNWKTLEKIPLPLSRYTTTLRRIELFLCTITSR